jgi:transposase
MLSLSNSSVYLHRQPVHMLKSFEGLSAIVQREFPGQLNTGSYFVFLNKNRSMIKVLFWDKDGFIIFYKRLEKGEFIVSSNGKTKLSRREFLMLFEGIQPRHLSRRFVLK